MSEPLKPFSKRRGDPLGLRPVAEHFANLLAPGLTGRTEDARWLTILCWCLKVRNDIARSHYEWLRPLELLWVARACKFGDPERQRQLPQRNAVQEWINHGGDRFGLSADQWRRYRQTGPYGAYRSMLISLKLIGDDSLIPGEAAKLADLINKSVFSDLKSPKGPIKPDTYWTKWRSDPTAKFLPERRDFIRRLSGGDAPILRRVLFKCQSESARRRKFVVVSLGQLPTIGTEAKLVARLASELQKDEFFVRQDVALLFPFMELADATMEILNQLWRECGDDLPTPCGVGLNRAVSATQEQLLDARSAAANWLRVADSPKSNVDLKIANQLAVVLRSSSPRKQLRGLLEHHGKIQSGLRWMRLKGTTAVVACSTRSQGEASTYRFRLWQLSRMAVQCGALKTMPKGLERETEADDDQ